MYNSYDVCFSSDDIACPPITSPSGSTYDMYYDFEQMPWDCSTALTDNPNFSPPSTINFVNGGADIQLAASYEGIFVHSPKTDCSLVHCSLMETGCLTSSSSTNFIMGQSPYTLSIKTSVS